MGLHIVRLQECDDQLETIVEIVLRTKQWGEALEQRALTNLPHEFLERDKLLGKFLEVLDKRRHPIWVSIRVLAKLIPVKIANPYSPHLELMLQHYA